MKQKLILLIICIFTVFLSSCGVNSPDEVQDNTKGSQTTGGVQALFASKSFSSFEDFEEHEKSAGDNGVTYYYVPSSLQPDYKLSKISKKDDTYVLIEYSAPWVDLSSENLSEYDRERLQTLICRYSLYADGKKALEENFITQGYKAVEYEGKTYYRSDEHAENDPTKRVIGYEIAFLENGDLIFMHLPAIDTFENMMKYTNLVKVEIK